ncbi:MAG: iron-containing redox enzyme family protein [Microcystis panniformis WG22]|uniref:Thiaminase-2/PQQC domain-containing protein n=1 Tax=Microcystis aeruginosa Ma_MB_F_20061100_S20D TaxID=2486253 RepID=A0A552EL88_MICAE|nr:iron-containing redox enzyme family protein [Microcystis panniformis WG22]TRU35230.1 MAG: hypothetical protein EWV78_11875 [Microcystis aeruginosa Ma_MB_F_20061100_S20D]TRU43319.1 MAG: hypothetical protein EWV50_01010 [Microcystis aeruginosa Ma_MB_F_20061100_S20]
MTATEITREKIKAYPRLKENIWHIDARDETALLITSQGEYEVSTKDALRFLEMRTYCTGHYSVEEIAQKSGLSPEDVTDILDSLDQIGVLRPTSEPEGKLDIEYVRNALKKGCEIWSGELSDTYIGNEFAEGNLPKTVLIGWQLEMYHYVKDFPHAIDHGAKRATGKLKEVLLKYADEERGHEEFVVQTLQNLGLSRQEIETSIPLVSTRTISFLMRELYELAPASVLMIAAVVEAHDFDEEGIQLFKEKLDRDYHIGVQTFDPFFEHQKVDWSLNHADLLAANIDLIEIDDVATLDQIVNKIHDLKHAFDLQGLEIKAYYTNLDGKYLPRQPVDFNSI